jgi:glycosyltransferase involved in cell wall biosynthesis
MMDAASKMQPDVIQIFSPLLIPVATYLKIRHQCKLIYDCYEYWLGSALTSKNYHLGICYALSHLLGAISINGLIFVYDKNPTRYIFKMISTKLLRRSLPDSIIYNIPSSDNLPTLFDTTNFKKSVVGNDKCFVIGYIGLLMPFKGYETAIKSMIYQDENSKLLLIGDSLDSHYKQKINKIICDNNLQSKVIITGILSHSEALTYCKICDLGLLLFENTSWTKYSTPNKLFEYMALGVPVVATNIPNISYFITKYSCGTMIAENNSKLLADLINNIKMDNHLLKKYSDNGCKSFSTNFTKDSQMKKLIDLYSFILSK